MASTSYCDSTNFLGARFSSGSSISYNGGLHSKWMQRLAIPQKSKFIIKCCIDEDDPEKKNKKFQSRPLNVVGLGSKRNAVLDFCLDSLVAQSSPIEFWTVSSGASDKKHFLRKMTGTSSFSSKGTNDEVRDDLLVENSSSLGSMILLVAGTGFDLDDKVAIKLLKAIKSNGGLAVSIVMKPFSFEGKRRQEDVENLIIKLAKVSNLSIVVDSDALLERETVTLTEALTTANNAVLLAIKSVSALLSDSYMKFLHLMPDQSELLSTSDVLNILQHSGKAVVGFGASYSIKASVECAAFNCPFLSGHLSQVIQDVVICVVASSQIMDRKDVQAAVCSFHRIAKSSSKIICSTVLDSSLEPNVIVSTIIITGVERNETTPKLSFWSQLSLRIPFSFDFFWGGLSSRSAGESALFPKETSCSKTTSSTSQRTSENDSQKPPTNDLFMTTKCQDGFIESDDGGFKTELPCTYKQLADKTSMYSSTGINEVVDNLNIRKQLSDEAGMINMDQVLSFKSSEVTRDFKGENIPYLDSTQGTCSNNSVHTNKYSNPTSNPGAKSQAEHQQSSSFTSTREFSLDSRNEEFGREYIEYNMNENLAGRTTKDERAKNKDESSYSERTGMEVRCPTDQASGRNNRVMPLLNKSSNNNHHSAEFVEAHNVGLPVSSKINEEDFLCWNGELDISAEAWANIHDGSQNNSWGEDLSFPIGVKFVNDINGNNANSKFKAGEGMQIEDGQSEYPQDASPSPWNGLADAGLNAMMDICYAASSIVFRNDTEDCQMQGSLSDRAASMLESERSLKRKWSPIIEMQYRGGIYKGRCQGGLPEGKGRLSYKDGSFYDGIWRHGKKCGIGAFYYSSGDVFQGSWRDDLMHGKGWFYFKNGDRWFAEFWKGKANGEGRYYSKHGDVYFGHFQDNWRHGEGLYIEPNGTRWYETWEHGVLLTRTQTESERNT